MPKHVYSETTRKAAVEALERGDNYRDVMKRFKIRSSSNGLLYSWRKKYAAGATPAKLGRPPKQPAPVSDEADRVRKAIVLLRQAEDDVDRRKREGKLREADNAHLYAGLALRLLQGDNGK